MDSEPSVFNPAVANTFFTNEMMSCFAASYEAHTVQRHPIKQGRQVANQPKPANKATNMSKQEFSVLSTTKKMERRRENNHADASPRDRADSTYLLVRRQSSRPVKRHEHLLHLQHADYAVVVHVIAA